MYPLYGSLDFQKSQSPNSRFLSLINLNAEACVVVRMHKFSTTSLPMNTQNYILLSKSWSWSFKSTSVLYGCILSAFFTVSCDIPVCSSTAREELVMSSSFIGCFYLSRNQFMRTFLTSSAHAGWAIKKIMTLLVD